MQLFSATINNLSFESWCSECEILLCLYASVRCVAILGVDNVMTAMLPRYIQVLLYMTNTVNWISRLYVLTLFAQNLVSLLLFYDPLHVFFLPLPLFFHLKSIFCLSGGIKRRGKDNITIKHA